MFCIKCGNPLPEDSVFCPKCGEPVDRSQAASYEQPQQPVQQQVEQPPVQQQPMQPPVQQPVQQPIQQPVQPPIQQQPMQPPVQQPMGYAQQPYGVPAPMPTPKKKRSKKKVVGGIFGCLLGVVLIAGIVLACTWQSIARSALGEIDFYLWREAATISEVFGTDELDDILEWQDFKSETNASLDIDDGDMKLDVALDMSHSTDKKQTVAVAKPVMELEGQKADLGTYKVDYQDKVLGFSAPEITDKQLVINFLDAMSDGGAALDELKELPESEEALKSIAKIIKSAEKDVLVDKFSKGKETLDGKSYTTVTLAISPKNFAEFARTVILGILADPEAKAFVEEYYNIIANAYANTIGEGDEMPDFDKLTDELIDELYDIIEEFDEEDMLYFTVFYDSSNNVVNRRISIPDEDVLLNIRTYIGDKESKLTFSYDDTDFELVKSESGDSVSYKLVMEEKGSYSEEKTTVSFDKLEVKSCNGVNVIVGQINITNHYVGDVDYVSDTKINVTAALDGDNYKITAYGKEEGYRGSSTIFELSSTTKLDDDPDLSKLTVPDVNNGVEAEEFFEAFADGFEDYIYNNIQY